jgi:hypothetical protein
MRCFFQLVLEDQWAVNGVHYSKTLEAWSQHYKSYCSRNFNKLECLSLAGFSILV